MNILKDIQTWYKLNCDGDWEHDYGLKIDTLDNPGWSLKIDLTDTGLEGFSISEMEKSSSEDWYTVKVEDNVFIGYGDFNKLEKLLKIFLDFLKTSLTMSKMNYTLYAPVLGYNEIPIWRPLIAKMIGINEFRIISCPEWNIKELKVREVDHFEQLPLDKIEDKIAYRKGDIVSCELITLFDYPSLVIESKLSAVAESTH